MFGTFIVGMTTLTTFQADIAVVRQGKERVDGLDDGTFVLRYLKFLLRIRWRFGRIVHVRGGRRTCPFSTSSRSSGRRSWGGRRTLPGPRTFGLHIIIIGVIGLGPLVVLIDDANLLVPRSGMHIAIRGTSGCHVGFGSPTPPHSLWVR